MLEDESCPKQAPTDMVCFLVFGKATFFCFLRLTKFFSLFSTSTRGCVGHLVSVTLWKKKICVPWSIKPQQEKKMPDVYLICVSVAFVLSEFLPFMRDTQANGLLHAIQLLASRAAGVLPPPPAGPPIPAALPIPPAEPKPIDRKKKRRSRSYSVDQPRIETTPMMHAVVKI
jgi:hypothetical protein